MVIVKLVNCNHNGRNNQNFKFGFWKVDFGLDRNALITEEFIYKNIKVLTRGSVHIQMNTKIVEINDQF